MTSNIGSRQLKDFGQGVGFTTKAKVEGRSTHSQGVIETALKRAFSPEFLNRIDDVVIFEPLARKEIHKIIEIELTNLFDRIGRLGYKMKVSAKAKDFIIDKGWDEQFGARPLKRAIQKYIEDQLAEEIISTKLSKNTLVNVDYDPKKDEIKITFIKPEAITKK